MDVFYFLLNDYDSVLVIVFIYGGYWQEGSKDLYSFVSNLWIKVGCIVVVLGYNFVLEVSVEQIIIEI